MLNLIKTCAICGKEFEAIGRNAWRAKYCSDDHYAKCQNCGTMFKITNLDNGIPKCCSKQCAIKLKTINCRNTIRAKYGVDNISQCSEYKAKISEGLKRTASKVCQSRQQTMISRYGKPFAMQVSEFKHKAEATNIERYGFDNPSKNSEIKDKISAILSDDYHHSLRIEKSLQNFGTMYPSQSEEIQQKMERTCMNRYGFRYASQNPDIKKQIASSYRAYFIKHYGVCHPSQVPAIHAKMVRNSFNNYAADGTHVDSKYEKCFYDFLLRANIEFEYQIPISYKYLNNDHVTYVDFKIGNTFFEVKGAHLLKGIYDKYKNVVPISTKLNVYASNNVAIITDRSMQSLFETSENLQGIDIQIFKEIRQNEQTVWKIIQTELAEGIKFVDCEMIKHKLSK